MTYDELQSAIGYHRKQQRLRELYDFASVVLAGDPDPFTTYRALLAEAIDRELPVDIQFWWTRCEATRRSREW